MALTAVATINLAYSRLPSSGKKTAVGAAVGA